MGSAHHPPAQGLVITLKSPPLPVSWARMMPPVIAVNGWAVPAPGHGRNLVPTAPGHYRIHVHLRYIVPSQIGSADHDAVVTPGRWTEIEYKPPLWAFARGSLGPPPQRMNGMIPILALLAVSLAVALLMLVVI